LNNAKRLQKKENNANARPLKNMGHFAISMARIDKSLIEAFSVGHTWRVVRQGQIATSASIPIGMSLNIKSASVLWM
tara:strand:- start:62 stop:292 length:231 start_codon:yes stop_codon:yes gene_type:complete